MTNTIPHPDFAGAVPFEESLLGSIVLDPAALDQVSLHCSQFFDHDLGDVYQLCCDLREAGKPIGDMQLLMAAIREQSLDMDSARLAKIFTSVPTARHARYYAAKVVEHYDRRQLFAIGQRCVASAVDPTTDSAQLAEETSAAIDAIQHRQQPGSYTLSQVRDEFIADLSSQHQPTTAMTGLYNLDCIVGGFRPGEMIVVAARPGCGKTSLAWQIAEHNAAREKQVLFVSLEMRRTELLQRVVSGSADVDPQAVRRREISDDAMRRIKAVAAEIAELPITIHDPAAATIRQIRGEARLNRARAGLGLLVIDYIGLLRPLDARQKRYEQVSEDSKAIKRLAKELDCPVVVLCQLNREADGQQPRLSHLRESGSIEQDADMVILLHRDRDDDFCLLIAKNRHGDTGKLDVRFDAQRTRFMDKDYSWQP